MYFLSQRFLIVLTGVLAAASATWGYSYNYNTPSGHVSVSAGPSSYQVSNGMPSVQSYPQRAAYKASVVSEVPNSIIPGEYRTIVKQGVDAASKASEALNELAPQLPAVLQTVSPAMKSNIEKVDEIINKVCDEVMFEAVPTSRAFQYFTPESIMKTCDYIREVSADMVAGLEDPAIYQNYVDEMNGALAKLNSFVSSN